MPGIVLGRQASRDEGKHVFPSLEKLVIWWKNKILIKSPSCLYSNELRTVL